MMNEIVSLIDKHKEWRERHTINLIPSENVMSPITRSLLASDLGHRYTSRDKFYMGAHFLDEIELQGEKIAEDLFGVETADLRPLSGHIADLITLVSLTKPDDNIVCVSAENGGYPGIWKQGLPHFLQLKVDGFPFQETEMNIDVDKAEEMIRNKKPSMMILGASLFLFPHPVQRLSKIAREIGVKVAYDASHVLGLIAGKQFQDPVREGAAVMFGSTHKSFFGPQGGIILANKEIGTIISRGIFPALVDNAHWNRIAALTLALAEMKEFGKEYATQVVKNAQALAKALADYEFPVACSTLGFTRSHQVYLDYGGFGKGTEVAERLEKANIITDCGIRLGVCEMTRRGMKQRDMLRTAEFIKRAIKDREQPSKIKPEISKFVREFQEVEYCFR